MRLAPILILGAAALAMPALALTVSPAPNRDQAQHLQQERSSGGVDLRNTLAAGGRPFAGGAPSGSTYSQSQSFGFGSVTTTFSSDRDDFGYGRDEFGYGSGGFRQTPVGPVYMGQGLRPLRPLQPRR
ncbi:hypothetical protein [uncultured Phenylobacterium sp.]|uniref:hypothetical protein n=1 Tax=uncultured Phenylobacterium sp. TaxID=349273 RepID=UPI0025E21357|nr:hypothetical protein [uncultured Phenylobacterium sp.]